MTAQFISPYLRPILLLVGSNVLMTLAWYGHLRFKETPLIGVILWHGSLPLSIPLGGSG